MKQILPKTFSAISLLLIIASWATYHFGVNHEINKLPVEQRARMAAFDWIGVEWIARGLIIFLIAVMFATAAFVFWIVNRKNRRKTSNFR